MRRWWAAAALLRGGLRVVGGRGRRRSRNRAGRISPISLPSPTSLTARITTSPAGSISRKPCAAEWPPSISTTTAAWTSSSPTAPSCPNWRRRDARFYNCLLRNRGDGTFEDVTARAGLLGKDLGFSFGVAAGDYDNDGHEDLFVCNAGRNTLYHNNGDGTFTDVTERSGIGTKPKDVLSVAAAWFDYDNDGKLDLIVSNYTVWTPQIDKICAVNGQEYYCHPKVYPSVAHRLYHNLGNGRFEDVTDSSGFGKELGKGMGIAIADFNGDGYMDVFVANDTVRNFLFINQKNGTFKESGYEWGVAYDENGNARFLHGRRRQRLR